MTENVYVEIRAHLDQPLSLDRLQAAAALAQDACQQSQYPLGLFVLSQVLLSLEAYWDDRGTISADTEIMLSEALVPPIRRYLDARARARLDASKEVAHLDGIVKAFFQWTATHAIPAHSDR
jgi:hypothetical protein